MIAWASFFSIFVEFQNKLLFLKTSSIPDWSCQWNMLVLKIKPCKFKYMKIYFETAKGSLEQLKSNRCNDYLDNECNSFANTCTMINLLASWFVIIWRNLSWKGHNWFRTCTFPLIIKRNLYNFTNRKV